MLSSAAPQAVARSRISIAPAAYIVSRNYDWFFFILSPFLAVFVGWFVGAAGLDQYRYTVEGPGGKLHAIAWVALLSAAFTHAHLVIVVFRTHLNREVFRRHPHRFTTVPLVLLTLCIASRWVFVLVSVLTVWWDVYHSSLQTFGLGRLYDRRAGNDVNLGRRIDYVFNLTIYTGPVLAGVNLAQHLASLKKFDAVGAVSLSELADVVLQRSEGLRAVVVVGGLASLAAFVLYYLNLARSGYLIPAPKLALYVVTGCVSIACWGFGSFGEAFLIMNFFHALQYFAIVWWSEKGNLAALFRGSRTAALGVLLVSGAVYGLWRAHRPDDIVPFLALGNVVSLMHFWYDGFVWSVRKGHV